jgi:hypothetical protein
MTESGYVFKYPQAWMNTSSQDRPPAFRVPTRKSQAFHQVRGKLLRTPNCRRNLTETPWGECSFRYRCGKLIYKTFFSKYHPISTYFVTLRFSTSVDNRLEADCRNHSNAGRTGENWPQMFSRPFLSNC